MLTKLPADTPDAYSKHLEAEVKREEDHLTTALSLYDEAILLYEKDANYAGIAEAYLGKFLTYKQFYLQTHAESDSKRAFAALFESEQLATKYDVKKLMPMIIFQQGNWYQLIGQSDDARMYFQRALDNFQGSQAEHGNYLYHLGFVEYKVGDKEKGLAALEKGLAEIRDHKGEVSSYVALVWESGCLLNLVEVLWKDNNQKAQEYLHEVEKVIGLDSKLVIRSKQLAQLKSRLGIA